SARASKPAGASVTDRTARSAGRRPRSARRIRVGSRSLAVSTLTTCPVACTPASVLPATLMTGGPPRIRSSAAPSSPSTVRSPGWAAQPAKRVPSYSTSSRRVRPAPGGASGVGPAAARRLPGDRDVPRHLEQHHRGRAPLGRAELHDARVAAVHVPEGRRDVVEKAVAHVLVAQERDRLPAGVEAAVLAERDGALSDAARHLRLGLGGLDAPVRQERRGQVGPQRAAVGARAVELRSLAAMAHGSPRASRRSSGGRDPARTGPP